MLAATISRAFPDVHEGLSRHHFESCWEKLVEYLERYFNNIKNNIFTIPDSFGTRANKFWKILCYVIEMEVKVVIQKKRFWV